MSVAGDRTVKSKTGFFDRIYRINWISSLRFAHGKEVAVPAKELKAVSRSLVSLTKVAKPQRKAGEFQVLFYPYPLILLASWRLEGITP
jgi:hypothetical protein